MYAIRSYYGHADGPMSDDNLVLREQPIPEPGEGELRVRGVYSYHFV